MFSWRWGGEGKGAKWMERGGIVHVCEETFSLSQSHMLPMYIYRSMDVC